jgi:hypothetical protein
MDSSFCLPAKVRLIGRERRVRGWQRVKALDSELGWTAVASTDGDAIIDRRDNPNIARLT